VFINYISNFDELMVILHYVNLLTPVGSCIVVNNIDTPSINKFINYIENNIHRLTIKSNYDNSSSFIIVSFNNFNGMDNFIFFS
jgi:hypothetical protein